MELWVRRDELAILAHLGLPTEAPIARARSPAFAFAWTATARAGAEGAGDVARAEVCREDDMREVRGSLGWLFRRLHEGEERARGFVVAG